MRPDLRAQINPNIAKVSIDSQQLIDRITSLSDSQAQSSSLQLSMRLDVRHERLWVGLCDYIHVCVCDKTHPVVTSCGCEQQVLTHSDGGSYLKRESAV